jgi:hypothetical protein
MVDNEAGSGGYSTQQLLDQHIPRQLNPPVHAVEKELKDTDFRQTFHSIQGVNIISH